MCRFWISRGSSSKSNSSAAAASSSGSLRLAVLVLLLALRRRPPATAAVFFLDFVVAVVAEGLGHLEGVVHYEPRLGVHQVQHVLSRFCTRRFSLRRSSTTLMRRSLAAAVRGVLLELLLQELLTVPDEGAELAPVPPPQGHNAQRLRDEHLVHDALRPPDGRVRVQPRLPLLRRFRRRRLAVLARRG